MMASITRKPVAPGPVITAKDSLLLAAALAFCVLPGCGDPRGSPEQAVRSWVEQGQLAAENKDRRTLADMISPSYSDARGYGRDDIENLFRIYFLRQHKVALLTRIDDIRVYDDSAAEFVLDIGMAGTNDGVLGFSADAYRFEMELEKDGNDWLLISARWGEIGDDLR